MFPISLKRISQAMKSSRFKHAVLFSLLILALVFGAVSASGPGRPPQPPGPPWNGMGGRQMPGMGGMQMPGMGGMQMPGMGGMQMPGWRPWMPSMPAQPVPKINIISVVEDESVTFETEDFPAGQDFTVTMGPIYSRGVNGTEVGSFNSGDGTPQQETFSIPKDLFGAERIAVRAQTSHYYPYFAFNWFYNSTAETTAAPVTTEGVAVEEAPAETETTTEEGVGGAEAPAEAQLTGVLWQWTEFSDPVQGTVAVENPELYTVTFTPEGLVGVKADCNNGSGTYIADEGTEGSIDIAISVVTLALCAPESLSDQFLQYLNDAAVFSFLDGGDLLLDLPIDTGTLRFAAAAAVEAPAEAGAEEPELSEAAASVTGTVTYLVRMALPDDAVVTVQIQDTSLADAPAVVVGEQVIETGGQQVPIAFEVAYNPDDIQEAKTYTMSARIEDSAGTLLFINDTSIPVITAGNPTQDVEIVTVPASPSTEGEAEAPAEGEADQLTGIVWTWTEFTDPVQGTLPIETPEQYTVEFLEDGTAAIKADCNTGSGSYVAEAGSLDITVGAVTLALCDADSLSDQFLQYLDAAAIYFFEEGDLFMDLPVDSGTLRFTAAAAEARSSTQVATVASLTAVRTTSVAAGGAGNDANGQEPTVPSFKICSVVRDESVFIVTENFPAGEEFVVKMGPAAEPRPMQSQPMPSWKPMPHNMGPMMGPSMGMQGMGAGMAQSGGMWQKPVQKVWIPYYEAGTLESGDGGQLEATFEIPEELAGVYRISIFLRTEHQYPYLAYNWFYNNTADVCNSTNGEA